MLFNQHPPLADSSPLDVAHSKPGTRSPPFQQKRHTFLLLGWIVDGSILVTLTEEVNSVSSLLVLVGLRGEGKVAALGRQEEGRTREGCGRV